MKLTFNVRRVLAWLAIIPHLLRRKTSSGWFLPEIDGLRFVAIATVLAVHVMAYTFGNPAPAPAWLKDHYEHLARGVQLFFVISGFVIAMPFVKRLRESKTPPPLKEFYVRRLTRLEPPFLIAMLLTYVALVTVHHSSALELLPHLLATCTYTHAIIYGSKSPIAFITWSLEIEVQFYLIAPLIMTALTYRPSVRRALLTGFAFASLVIRTFIAVSHPVLAASLLAYLPYFIAGILVCDFAIANDFWRNRRSRVWDAAGSLALAAAYSMPSAAPAGTAVMSALFGVAVLSVFRGVLLKTLMSLAWITAIGGMCYTIYLLHVPLIYLWGHATKKLLTRNHPLINTGIQFLLLPLPVLAICSLFFLAIEKPCMNKHWPQDVMCRVRFTKLKRPQVEIANV